MQCFVIKTLCSIQIKFERGPLNQYLTNKVKQALLSALEDYFKDKGYLSSNSTRIKVLQLPSGEIQIDKVKSNNLQVVFIDVLTILNQLEIYFYIQDNCISATYGKF